MHLSNKCIGANSTSKSMEYKLFKIKLSDMIQSLQDLSKIELDEAINLIYYDLGCIVKASITLNKLPSYNYPMKDQQMFSLPMKSGVLKVDKPIDHLFSNETLLSEDISDNFDIYSKRSERLEINTTGKDPLEEEELSCMSNQSKTDASFKNNFIEMIKPINDDCKPITCNILNLCSKNKVMQEQKSSNLNDEAILDNTYFKERCESSNNSVIQAKNYKEKLQPHKVQACIPRQSNEDFRIPDLCGLSSSVHAKLYICNDQSICTELIDSTSNNQKKANYIDAKSKSSEISLWKIQPEIYSDFQPHLVENLDLFNVNFSKPDESNNIAEIIPLKEPTTKCSNSDQLENNPLVYGFSNNFVEMTICKESTYNNDITQSSTALNLVNRKKESQQNIDSTLNSINVNLSTVPQTTNKHESTSPLSCLNCKSVLEDVSLFNRHQLNCSKNRLICVYCLIKCSNRMTFLKHISAHERNTCKKCSESFSHFVKLKQHMENIHNVSMNRKIYTCHYCTRSFSKQASLFYHYKQHAKGSQKVCEKCGTFCTDNNDYNQHMSNHFKTGLRCHKCDEIFLRKQQYEKHLQAHDNYKCDYCSMAFSCKRKLFRHCKEEHRRRPKVLKLDKQYPCDQCRKTFNRPSYLILHKKTHLGIKPVECALCGKGFSEMRSLLKHKTSYLHQYNVFLKTKPRPVGGANCFLCEYCKLYLPSQKMLQFHCDLEHKCMPRKCPQCGFKAESKDDFKKHARSHNKSFMCEVCGRGFRTYSILKDHHAYLHSSARNFTCGLCSKTFKLNSLLSRHMKTHNLEKRFKCLCGAAFKQMSNLTRHMASVHSQGSIANLSKNVANDIKPDKHTSNDTLESSMEYRHEAISTNEDLVLAADDIQSNSQFTVFDSQLIQFVPSALQFEENLQSVSIINSDLTSFTIPAGYTISQAGDSIMAESPMEQDLESYDQLTATNGKHAKIIKKKGFNVHMDSIGMTHLEYDNITAVDSVSISPENVQSSMKENVSEDAQILHNIIF